MEKILLVEDLPIAQMLTKKLITDAGYEMVLAKTGEEAVALADNSYILIVMDIGLPAPYGSEGGVRATKEIRAKGVTVPIIGLTANADEAIQALMKEAGANGCVSKPLDLEKLKKLIK